MKRVVATILLGFFMVTVGPFSALAFYDIQRHWAKNTIDHLASRGVVAGKSNEVFAPEMAVNRAEFATLMVNSLDLDEEALSLQKGTSSFKDVPPNFWTIIFISVCPLFITHFEFFPLLLLKFLPG